MNKVELWDDGYLIETYSSKSELDVREELVDLLQNCPIPKDQLLGNLGLFLEAKHLSRLLYFDFLYKQIIDLQGVIFDFGTRWGNIAAVFSVLRSIYEPYNRHRKIVMFDTFTGFPSLTTQDGTSKMMKPGQLATTDKYDEYLTKIMNCHEQLNPLAHVKRYELCIGDATVEVPKYLKQQPETIIALVYFDFDLYKPTKECIEFIKPRLIRGSMLAFDELNDIDSPGETIALMETLGLNNISLRRYRYTSRVSYFVYGE